MTKKLFITILIALLMGSILFGCGENPIEQTTEKSSETQAETTTEDPLTLNPSLMEIATKYGGLMYPERWKNMVRTQVVEDENTRVEMYAAIGSHKEIHLYDVVFGGDEGVCIGDLLVDGKTVYVNLVSYSTDFDDSWSEEETQTVHAMKEDINYLIDALNELK